MERFQLKSTLKLPLFSGFTIVHSIGCVGSCRPFVTVITSAGLIGCRKVSSVYWLSKSFFCLPAWATEETFRHPIRPADNVTTVTKGLKEPTLPTESDHDDA